MKTALFLAAFLLTTTVQAQNSTGPDTKDLPYWIFGQAVEQRASTRIGYWLRDRDAGLGVISITYGRPLWKTEYNDKLDAMTRGKMWRMGDNYWTLLDTNVKIRLGGVDVPAGLYFLATRRSADGATWELVFIDPEKSRSRRLDSYDVGTRPGEIPVLFTAPLAFHKTDESVERLTMLLKLDDDSTLKGNFSLHWGNFSLTTSLEVELPSE